jgi:hypothetical protein
MSGWRILASHILALILQRLRSDWQRKYNLIPRLAETFVERPRFSGVCYRAANWLLVGQSWVAAGTIVTIVGKCASKTKIAKNKGHSHFGWQSG